MFPDRPGARSRDGGDEHVLLDYQHPINEWLADAEPRGQPGALEKERRGAAHRGMRVIMMVEL